MSADEPPWSPGEDGEESRPFGQRPLFSARPSAAGDPSTVSQEPPPPPDPRSPRSSNLRGTINRDQPSQTSARGREDINVDFRREPRLTSFGKCPDALPDYVVFREEIEGKILGSGIGARKGRLYLEELGTFTIEALCGIPTDDQMADLDVKFYAEVVACMKGTKMAVHILDLQQEVPRGCGRAAMRKLDSWMQFEIKVLALEAQKNVERCRCGHIGEVENFLTKYKYDRFILRSAGQPLADYAVYNKLLTEMKPYEKEPVSGMNGVFSVYDALPAIQQDVNNLINNIMIVAVAHRTRTQKNQNQNASGRIAKAGERAKCKGCGKTSHSHEKCWVLHPEQKMQPKQKGAVAGTVGPGGGPPPPKVSKKQKAAAAAANKPVGAVPPARGPVYPAAAAAQQPGQRQKGGMEGPYEPCLYCGRKNHEAASCFYKPLPPGPQDKAGRIAAISGGYAGAPAVPIPAQPSTPGWTFISSPGWYPVPQSPNPATSVHGMAAMMAPPMPPHPHTINPLPMPQPAAPHFGAPDQETLAYLAFLRGTGPPAAPSGQPPRWPGTVATVRDSMSHTDLGRRLGEAALDLLSYAQRPTVSYRGHVEYCETRMRGTLAALEDEVKKAMAADTGASRHIVDPNHSSVNRLEPSPGEAIVEGVTGDAQVDHIAWVKIPGIEGLRRALVVVGSPPCISLGEFVMDENFLFIWEKAKGPVLYSPDGKATLMEVDNNVPYFIPENRPTILASLAQRGYVKEVRMLERMSDQQLSEHVQIFRNATERYATARTDAAKAGMTLAQFLSTGAAATMKEAIDADIQNRKALNVPPGPDQSTTPKPYVCAAKDCKNSVAKFGSMCEDCEKKAEEAPGSIVAPIPRIEQNKRKFNRKKKEQGHDRSAVDPLPRSHYWSHTPMDDRCHTCIDTKMRRYPSFSVGETDSYLVFLKLPGELVSIDMTRTRGPDYIERRWYLATWDHVSHRPRGAACSSKEAEVTWAAFEKAYPGSRINPNVGDPQLQIGDIVSPAPEEERAPFPKQISSDGDPSWGGIFTQKVLERGGNMRTSVPYRSSSNSIIERWIEELERGVACLLEHASAPQKFWSAAAQCFEYSFERTHIIQRGPCAGMTPFRATWGYDFTGELLIFGCAASYWVHPENKDNFGGRDKFAKRSLPGIFLYYAKSGAVVVMDEARYRDHQEICLRETKDFQADSDEFPFMHLGHLDTEESIFAFVDESEPRLDRVGKDDRGTKRCMKCGKVDQSEPVTCASCLEERRHKAGKPAVGCKRNRCTGCYFEEDENGEEKKEEEEEDGAEARRRFLAPGSASPRSPGRNVEVVMADTSVEDRDAPASVRSVANDIIFARAPQFGLAKVPIRKASTYERRPRANHDRLDDLARARIEDFEDLQPYQEFLRDLKRELGTVCKVYPPGAREVKENPDAMKSVLSEMEQLVEKKAFDPMHPVERASLSKLDEEIRVVDLMMITALKNIESPALQRWKSRAVARGDQLKTLSGEKVAEDLQHVTPSSLEAIRFVIAWECLCGPDSVTLQGDVPGAYLTARLSGPRTFLRVPRFLWLPKWPDPSKYVDPLFELAVALYGLQRGDTCWGGRSQRA
jgi:hypothetical protein